MIELTHNPIDVTAVLAKVSSAQAGAVVLFLGTTREFTKGRQTKTLHYECYSEMAEKKLVELESQAREKWLLVECVIVHRLGEVPLEQASVAIAVSSQHREVAFQAGKWLIDTLKVDVPIWKQEHWVDGATEWVHPGLSQGPG